MRKGTRFGMAASLTLVSALSAPVPVAAGERLARFASCKGMVEQRIAHRCDDQSGSETRMEIRRPRCQRPEGSSTGLLWSPPPLMSPYPAATEGKPINLEPGPKGPERAVLPSSRELRGRWQKRQEWNSSDS